MGFFYYLRRKLTSWYFLFNLNIVFAVLKAAGSQSSCKTVSSWSRPDGAPGPLGHSVEKFSVPWGFSPGEPILLVDQNPDTQLLPGTAGSPLQCWTYSRGPRVQGLDGESWPLTVSDLQNWEGCWGTREELKTLSHTPKKTALTLPAAQPRWLSPFVAKLTRLASPDRRSHIFHFRNITDQEEIIRKYTKNSLHLSLGSPDSEGGDGEKVGKEKRERVWGMRMCVCPHKQPCTISTSVELLGVTSVNKTIPNRQRLQTSPV